MILETKYHGEVSYDESEIIHFEKGVLGFENLKKFIVFPLKDNEVFNVVHSVEDKNIGFVVASPFMICKDYEFELNDIQEDVLKVKCPNDVCVLNIVTLNSDVSKITINLRAPLIINIKERIGEQIVLGSEKYKIKTPIIGEKK